MKKHYPGFTGRLRPLTRLAPSQLLLALLMLSGGAWAQGFSPKTDYPTGSGPRSVAVGDFNADGKPDLATANENNNTVSVLISDGAGGFLARTDYPTGTNPYSVAVGDFNADGKPDLATANNNGNTVSVLLSNGAGGFLAPTDYPTGTNPYSVAVGDFNADGKPDLAVANNGGDNVSVLPGDGAGGFLAGTDYPTGSRPVSVAVGDFNADGKPDLATANYNGNTVSVLLSNGAGGFLAPTDYPTGSFTYSVAVGDFNADGKPDLATANFNGNTVSVLPGDGAGGFLARTDYPTGSIPIAVAVGDFNADGKSDLATANIRDNTVSVLLNATCTTPTPYAVTGGGAYCAGGSGRAVGLAGSEPGVNYQLKRDGNAQGSPVAGTGEALDFGPQTVAGSYTVAASAAVGNCVAEMTGSVAVSVNPLPTTFAVSGGGAFCAGGAGVAVGLTNSQSGVNYQLKRDNSNAGSPVAGTGAAISFGNQTLAGTYTVTATNATTSCTAEMSGSATVIVNALPTVNAGPDQSVVLGFGSNCTNLTATPSGGSGNGYNYTWNPGNLPGQTVNVCPIETTTYTVTLTDGNGCQATDQVIVRVQDVRCGPGNKNVQICYYGVSQCVSEKIAKNYLKLGATLGACGGSANTRTGYEAEAAGLTLSLKAYPNPVQDAVTVEVLSPAAGSATFRVLDLTGRARQSRTEPLAEGLNQVQFQLGGLPSGIYIIQAQDILGRNAAVRVKKQ